MHEENETFTIALNTPSNATVSGISGSATITITDDDDAPTISLGDLSATEEAGIQNLVATLSTASERVVSVTYATSDKTASAGDDYTAGTGTITFNVGDTTKNVPVAILKIQ